MSFTNATDAAISFTPYATTSVWRSRISANPKIASYSAAVVATQFSGGQSNTGVRANEAGMYDYNHPKFFATATDPLVRVVCTQYCGTPDNGGVPAQIHIPAKARPAGGDDSHLDVVQPDGTEITMWGTAKTTADWTSGATLSAANTANCGSYATGQGWLASGPARRPRVSATMRALSPQPSSSPAKSITPSSSAARAPSARSIRRRTGPPPIAARAAVGPPLGGREWYDVPCATTQANSALRPWEKAILCALNQYGAYLGDDAGGGANFTDGVAPLLESEEPWNDVFGSKYTSPFAALTAQGWYSFTMTGVNHGANGTRWVGADPGVRPACHSQRTSTGSIRAPRTEHADDRGRRLPDGQPVSAARGMDRDPRLNALELPAQTEDVRVEAILARTEVVAGPERVDELRLRHDTAGPREQSVGHGRLDGGQLDLPAVDAQNAEVRVEFRSTGANGVAGRRRRDEKPY